jgi:hypothetical protein
MRLSGGDDHAVPHPWGYRDAHRGPAPRPARGRRAAARADGPDWMAGGGHPCRAGVPTEPPAFPRGTARARLWRDTISPWSTDGPRGSPNPCPPHSHALQRTSASMSDTLCRRRTACPSHAMPTPPTSRESLSMVGGLYALGQTVRARPQYSCPHGDALAADTDGFLPGPATIRGPLVRPPEGGKV